MTISNPPSLILQAIEALKRFDRRAAVALIREDMRTNTAPGERWRSIAKLADKIGEIDLSVEAMRRYAATEPRTLDRLLAYCSELATRGRIEECLAEIDRLPRQIQEHAAVLHLRGAVATQIGDFAKAEPLIRRTIAEAKLTGQNWLGLAMIKKFCVGDPDIAEMERLRPMIGQGPTASQATFLYALGKVYHDIKNYDEAFDAYSAGAALRKAEEKFDADANDAFIEKVIASYTPQALASLKPSQCDSERAIFVTGVPRSGTTLVEQILTSHSAVTDGGEINLFRGALQPAGDFTWEPAQVYDARGGADPWGDVARDFLGMLDQRFGRRGRIVDKTLNHSRFMGLILHALPNARVVWLRRNPEDVAISVFRNYFSSPVAWSWSLNDIGRYMRADDRLHAHWSAMFPDRILTVAYEAMVTEPAPWIERILAHARLPREDAVFAPHAQRQRAVRTASVAQVREPISAAQVDAAMKYARFMDPFRNAYFFGK